MGRGRAAIVTRNFCAAADPTVMVAAGKRARLAGGSTCDRLSTLPDDLLHRVLSFLPSRELVQTSVLSKRWTGLWRSAPCIDIDILGFPTTVGDGTNVRIYAQLKQQWEKMEDFTTNLLMFHNAPTLDTLRFRIDWVDHDRVQAFNRLIRRDIMYRPSVLEIVLFINCRRDPYVFRNLGVSSSCRLKRLHLSGLSLDTSFSEHLRDKCPVLEDRDLHDCDHKFREIQSSTLMNLRIVGVLSVELVIRAPALATLILRIHGDSVSLDGSTNSLATSSIFLHGDLPLPIFPPECMTLRNRVALLGSLFNVTKLELSGFSATVMLDEEFDKSPIFKNLRILSLQHCLGNGSDVDRKFKALGRFLQKAPNLEKLTLEDCWFSDDSKEKKNKRKTSEIPLDSTDQKTFQCESLKLIEMKYIGRGGADDDQMFQIMQRLWSNLQKATFKLIKP